MQILGSTYDKSKERIFSLGNGFNNHYYIFPSYVNELLMKIYYAIIEMFGCIVFYVLNKISFCLLLQYFKKAIQHLSFIRTKTFVFSMYDELKG